MNHETTGFALLHNLLMQMERQPHGQKFTSAVMQGNKSASPSSADISQHSVRNDRLDSHPSSASSEILVNLQSKGPDRVPLSRGNTHGSSGQIACKVPTSHQSQMSPSPVPAADCTISLSQPLPLQWHEELIRVDAMHQHSHHGIQHETVKESSLTTSSPSESPGPLAPAEQTAATHLMDGGKGSSSIRTSVLPSMTPLLSAFSLNSPLHISHQTSGHQSLLGHSPRQVHPTSFGGAKCQVSSSVALSLASPTSFSSLAINDSFAAPKNTELTPDQTAHKSIQNQICSDHHSNLKVYHRSLSKPELGSVTSSSSQLKEYMPCIGNTRGSNTNGLSLNTIITSSDTTKKDFHSNPNHGSRSDDDPDASLVSSISSNSVSQRYRLSHSPTTQQMNTTKTFSTVQKEPINLASKKRKKNSLPAMLPMTRNDPQECRGRNYSRSQLHRRKDQQSNDKQLRLGDSDKNKSLSGEPTLSGSSNIFRASANNHDKATSRLSYDAYTMVVSHIVQQLLTSPKVTAEMQQSSASSTSRIPMSHCLSIILKLIDAYDRQRRETVLRAAEVMRQQHRDASAEVDCKYEALLTSYAALEIKFNAALASIEEMKKEKKNMEKASPQKGEQTLAMQLTEECERMRKSNKKLQDDHARLQKDHTCLQEKFASLEKVHSRLMGQSAELLSLLEKDEEKKAKTHDTKPKKSSGKSKTSQTEGSERRAASCGQKKEQLKKATQASSQHAAKFEKRNIDTTPSDPADGECNDAMPPFSASELSLSHLNTSAAAMAGVSQGGKQDLCGLNNSYVNKASTRASMAGEGVSATNFTLPGTVVSNNSDGDGLVWGSASVAHNAKHPSSVNRKPFYSVPTVDDLLLKDRQSVAGKHSFPQQQPQEIRIHDPHRYQANFVNVQQTSAVTKHHFSTPCSSDGLISRYQHIKHTENDETTSPLIPLICGTVNQSATCSATIPTGVNGILLQTLSPAVQNNQRTASPSPSSPVAYLTSLSEDLRALHHRMEAATARH